METSFYNLWIRIYSEENVCGKNFGKRKEIGENVVKQMLCMQLQDKIKELTMYELSWIN